MSVALRWSVLVAAEAGILVFLLMYGLTFTHSVPLHRVQIGVLATLGGIGWAVILVRPRLLPAPLVFGPLPLLGALAITSVTSAFPSLASYAVWQSAAYVGIAWLLAIQAGNATGRRNLVAVIGIVAAVVTVVYVTQVLYAWVEWSSLGFPISTLPLRPSYSGGLLAIPGWLADAVVLSTPVVVVWLWIGRARAPAVALALCGVIAIVLSGTRSVLLILVALAVVAALFLIPRATRRTRIIGATGLVAVVGVGLGVVASASRGFDLGRSSSFASAIARLTESPLVGSGPGTYGVGRMSDPVDGLHNLTQPDASNVLLTNASDSGIVGLIGLGVTVIVYGYAIWTAWRDDPADRPVRLAAMLGVLVVAGHAMGEVVFALIGVVVLSIGVLMVAAAPAPGEGRRAGSRPRWSTASLVAGVLILVASTTAVVRGEITLEALERADAALAMSPNLALDAARDATDTSPDSVPAWWVRMVAADAVGDTTDSLTAARRIVELEGFGQQWLSLGVLLLRSGDAAGARDAVDRAVDSTVYDPVVELNAAIFYEAAGAADEARRAMTRLLVAQPDIEPILNVQLPRMAEIAASVRGDTATGSIAVDPSTAFLIALSAEDRSLADELLTWITARDPAAAEPWRTIVAAWFGDGAARASHEAQTWARPTGVSLAWSWRLAVRACDPPGADRWERATEIQATSGYHPSMPISMGTTPSFHVRMLPPRYPDVVWRTDHPWQPYVKGIWTYALGRAPCTKP